MASRYLKAAIPTLEPGYVPLPLEFINQKITGDQTKFDTAASQVAALNALKQEVAPWDVGKEKDLLGKYTPQIDILAEQLYKTGQVGQVVPQISKLQQQWLNDPTRKYLQAGFDWYTQTELPRQKEKGYAEAFNELRTPEGDWRGDINNYQLQSYKYVPWDQDKWIQDNLNNWVANSYAKATGADSAEIVMVGGVPQIKETRQGKTETKGIGPEFGSYYNDAVNALTDQVMSGDFDAATWLKGKKGKDREAILDYISNLATQKKFMQTDITPGTSSYGNVPEGFGYGAGKPMGDFGVDIQLVPVNTSDESNYLQINKNIDNLQMQQDVVKNGYQMTSAKVLEQFPQLANYVKANISKGADPEMAMNEGFQLAVQYADSLPAGSQEKLSMQGALADMNKQITEYNNIGSKKFIFEQQRQFVDDEVSKRILSDKTIVDNLSKNDYTLIPYSKDIGKTDIGFNKVKEEDRGKFVNLLKEVTTEGGFITAPSGVLQELFDLSTGSKGLDMETYLDSPGHKNKFLQFLDTNKNIIASKSSDPALYKGIKFDAKSFFIQELGNIDTQTEEWNKTLQNSYKTESVDKIARTSGFINSDEMIKSAVAYDGKLGKGSDYKFDNVKMLQFGSTPTALYTFTGTVDDKPSTVQVVAPLSNINNNKIVQDSAIEMFNKGRTEGNNALASSSAQLLVTSSLSEDEYGKLLFLFRANTSDYKPLTFNIQGTDASVSKVGGSYIVDVAGQKIPVAKEEDVLTILGTSILDKIQTQAFGVTGGGSPSMGKGTTWVPQ